MLSFILKLKAKYDKAQVKAEQKRIDEAKERVKKRKTVQQAKEEKEQEKKEKKEKTKQEESEAEERQNEAEKEKEETEAKKDEELSKKQPNKFKAVMSNVASGFVGFFESLPVVFFVIKIVTIVLIIVIIANIIFSAMSAITNVVVDTTLGAMTAMDFTNAFEASKMSSGVDEDGEYRIYFQKGGAGITTIEDDPDDPDPPDNPDEPEVISDIDLWCNISDREIKDYIVDKKWSDLGGQMQNEYFNLMRMVRMAYRICYTKDENGERYIKGLKPQTLMGILFFEKGYGWMQVGSCTGALCSGCNKDGEWYHLEGTTWVPTEDSTDYNNTNVDDCVAGCYLHKHGGWETGPLSWDCGWDENMALFNSNERYAALLTKLLEYPEYESMKVLSPLVDTSSVTMQKPEDLVDKNGNAVVIDYDVARQLTISSLFYNLLCTAVHYDSCWWDGTTKGSDISCSDYNNAFIHRFAYVDTSAGKTAVINTVGKKFPDASSDEYFDLLYGTAASFYGDDITEAQYNDWVSEMANLLYYQYHHFPSWEVIYDCCYAYWKEEKGAYVPVRIRDLGYKVSEYYCSLELLFAAYLTVMEGHTMNAVLPDMAYVPDGTTFEYDNNGNLIPQPEPSGLAWRPLGTDNTYVKSILAGAWMYYSGYYPKCTTQYYGAQDIDDITSNNEVYDGMYTCSEDSYLRITAGRAKKLDTSLWNYIDTEEEIRDAWGVPSDDNMYELWEPISFAAENVTDNIEDPDDKQYANLHEMHVGGAGVAVAGSNIIRSLTEAVYEWVPGIKQDPGPGGDDPTPVDIDITKLLGKPVYTAGKAFTIDDVNDRGHAILGELVSPVFPVTDRDETKDGIQNSFGTTYALQNGYGHYASGGNHCGVDIPQSAGSSDVTATFCSKYLELLKSQACGGNLGMYLSFDESCDYFEQNGQSDLLTKRQEVLAIGDGIVSSIRYNLFKPGQPTENPGADGNNYYMRHFFLGSDNLIYEITYGYYHLCPDHVAIYTQAYDTSYRDTIDTTFGAGNYYDGDSYFDATQQIKPSGNVVIKEGSLIGYMGSTGYSTGPHLHLDVQAVSIYKTKADVEAGAYISSTVRSLGQQFDTVFADNLESCYSIFMGYDNSNYKHGSNKYPLHTSWLETFTTNDSAIAGTFELDYDISDIKAFEEQLGLKG